jgi:hypothetical protein
MKHIKNYLHLYLNQPIVIWFEDKDGKFTLERNGKLSWNHEEDCEYVLYTLEDTDDAEAFEFTDYRFKLLLRPLSDITDEEVEDLDQIGFSLTYPNGYLRAGDGNKYQNISIFGVSEAVKYLLSKGFDIFDLIDAGLAINKCEKKSSVNS